MTAPLGYEKNDPFIGCCIPGCITPLFSPADLFCEPHAAKVPVEITKNLELTLKQPGDVNVRRWRELIDQARQAVTAAATT
jgi:hypothetical protein